MRSRRVGFFLAGAISLALSSGVASRAAAETTTTPANAGAGRVWVAPFDEAAGDQPKTPGWISKALRQSVADDLASIPGLNVAAPSTQPAAASGDTRPANVDYVVTGTIQRVDGDLRVTGRIEQPASNKIVGGFKATGTERELFAI